MDKKAKRVDLFVNHAVSLRLEDPGGPRGQTSCKSSFRPVFLRLWCFGRDMPVLLMMAHLVHPTGQMGFIGRPIGPRIGSPLGKAAFVGTGSNCPITIIVAVITLVPREVL